MATADIIAGSRGIDASIIFESDRGENVGNAFVETQSSFTEFVATRSSLADLFALSAIFAIGACSNGTMINPLRAERVDARKAEPPDVPQPQEDIATHTAAFARQGFNATKMIELVACGRTIGGVHGVDFPEIAPFEPDGDLVCPNCLIYLRHKRKYLDALEEQDNEHTEAFNTSPHFCDNKVYVTLIFSVRIDGSSF